MCKERRDKYPLNLFLSFFLSSLLKFEKRCLRCISTLLFASAHVNDTSVISVCTWKQREKNITKVDNYIAREIFHETIYIYVYIRMHNDPFCHFKT